MGVQWVRRLSVFAYCSLIFFLSSQQVPESFPSFRGLDWVIHFLEFGLLAFLFFRMFSFESLEFFRKYLYILSWVSTVLYGALDELHQAFVPTRHMSVWDWMADAAGAAAILGLVFLRAGVVKSSVRGAL